MTLPLSTPQALASLAPVGADRVATQVLYKTGGGSATVLAFRAGQGLREHTNPDDALLIVVDGRARISVAGEPHAVSAGETIRLPATVPHAVEAETDMRMLLVLLHGAS